MALMTGVTAMVVILDATMTKLRVTVTVVIMTASLATLGLNISCDGDIGGCMDLFQPAI